MNDTDTYVAFYGKQQIANGLLTDMLHKTNTFLKDKETSGDEPETLLIFKEHNGAQIDFDFRGSIDEILEKAQPQPKKRSAGRPKLGVTSREITLLPRHWEWLELQPKSASASLRLLVEEAMKRDGGETELKKSIAAIDRIMMVMAGDQLDFEEASRALNQRNLQRLKDCAKSWPEDIKQYVTKRFSSALDAVEVQND